jgi:predicted dehydrogenase
VHPAGVRDPLSPSLEWTYHRITVHGTTGRLEIDGDAPHQGRPLVRIHRGAGVTTVPLAEPYDADGGLLAFAREVATLVDCLEDPGLRHPLEAESARATLEVLLAVYESSRSRQLVRLPLTITDNPLITMLEEGVI